jgi:hypothetical protein
MSKCTFPVSNIDWMTHAVAGKTYAELVVELGIPRWKMMLLANAEDKQAAIKLGMNGILRARKNSNFNKLARYKKSMG